MQMVSGEVMGLKETLLLIFLALFLVVSKKNGVEGRAKAMPIEQDLELERQLEILNKPALKTIKTEEGDIYDCVDVNKQPAFDHPLLKNHTIKMRPNYMKKMTNKAGASKKPLFKSVDCPQGSVPIRRTQKEDLIRAKSLSNTLRKRHMANIEPLGYPAKGYHYSRLDVSSNDVNQKFYGAQAFINLWNPSVANGQYSSSQFWIQTKPPSDQLNIIEAGWTVNPLLYGDARTRFFTYWTSDSYQKTGCFNLMCPGFIQVDPGFAIDGYFANVSSHGGDQYDLQLQIHRDDANGNWILMVNDDTFIGYWPNELLPNLGSGASEIHFGGQVHADTGVGETPEMGSGYFPVWGYQLASYFSWIQVANTSAASTYGALDDGNYKIASYQDSDCYDITDGGSSNKMGYHIYYGGPNCNNF